jgi:quercetin dioxygenase-like cupin family protein
VANTNGAPIGFARTQQLLDKLNKTMEHWKGVKSMKSEESFSGFSVAAGQDRLGEHISLGGREPLDCKVSGKDTGGALCVFEFTGASSGPRRVHRDQSEWIYVVRGELDFEVGEKRFRASAGECVFIPRQVAAAWLCLGDEPARILDVYQPAGKIEAFFREIGKYSGKPAIHEVLSLAELKQLFRDHDIDLVGPPLSWDAPPEKAES